MTMRLIDADMTIKNIHERSYISKALSEIFETIIDEQPTVYDVDKVVEQLEEEREHSHADFEQYAELHGIDSEDDWFYAGLKRAITIINAGGIDE